MATNAGSLGIIHRQYNKTLKEAIANLRLDSEFKPSDNDTENFTKIDVANHKRDVDYILSVLKCEDSACVSRALKRCAWLVTEPQHAHIVNPHYLHQHLFPHMTTKNYIKLMKHIKLTLKDETRAEEFYSSEKDRKVAVTWLPLCSVSFIEKNIERHLGTSNVRGKIGDLKVRTFKKLCEKSDTIFEVVMKKEKERSTYSMNDYFEALTFLLQTNADLYLDILEDAPLYVGIHLSDKATDMIMKHSLKRVIDKFEKYVAHIHVPTFVKHLKRDDVKTFLYEQAKKQNIWQYDDTLGRISNFLEVIIKHFIKKLHKDEQFKFVKDVFIDKVYAKVPLEELLPHTEAYGMMKLCEAIQCNAYSWYEYATFDIANEAYVKEITENQDQCDKYGMLAVLLKCADHNVQHIRTVLQHILEDKRKQSDTSLISSKLIFINQLLSVTHINDYDEISWDMLNEIFTAVNVYKEDSTDDQQCVRFIIIYSTVHGITIPKIILKKFEFDTLKSYKTTMIKEQREKIFSYLYEYLLSLLNEPIVTEEQFANCIKTLENVLQLFIDWEKEILDYPLIVNTINEFVTIKKEHSWKTNLSSLYNKNKKWRRHLFSASLSLCASEEACLNVLKHEPRLLARHGAELHALRTAPTAPRRLLTKLRIYWPHTIAKEWTDEYNKLLNDVAANKALIRGLCTLLPQEPLMKIIKENAPENGKIDRNEVDERTIELRRFIASNMHVARPQPTPEAILLYAKGDYIKFALPSVLAMFYNLKASLFKVHIPKVLDAPVSLQKHGLTFVYRRCNEEETKEIFLNSWKISKNLSIRAVIFNFTHTLLCNENDNTKITELWKVIETFIDSLTFEEDKKIYELLFKIENVPLIVRGKYLMKSYCFMQKFLPHAKSVHVNYEERTARLGEYCRHIMEHVSPDFASDLINLFVDKMYYKERFLSNDGMIQVISAYLLSAKDELTQMERYEKVLVPIMQRSWDLLNENSEQNNIIRKNFISVLACLSSDLKDYVVHNNLMVPTKMFIAIQEFNKSISIQRNYLFITEWKLIVELTKLVEEAYSTDNEWFAICWEIAPEFGKICVDNLKEDIKLHFPCIYLLFGKALNYILPLMDGAIHNVIFEQFLSDEEFIEGYLLTINLLADVIKVCGRNYENIKSLLYNHTSVEIKFHCSNRIG